MTDVEVKEPEARLKQLLDQHTAEAVKKAMNDRDHSPERQEALSKQIEEMFEAKFEEAWKEKHKHSVPGSNETHNGKKFQIMNLVKARAKKDPSLAEFELDIVSQTRALATTDDEAAGDLIPMEIATEIIEASRPEVFVFDLGAREFSLSGHPYKIRREAGTINPVWTAEANTYPTSDDPKLDWVTFRPHKMTSLNEITEEQMTDAPATETWLRSHIAREFGIKTNYGVLLGDGMSESPIGITNTDGIQTVDMSSITGNVTFDKLNEFPKKLRDTDNLRRGGENLGWAMASGVVHDIVTMDDKVAAGPTPTDVNVQPLHRRMLTDGVFDRLLNYKYEYTTLLPATGKSIIFGDWSTVWVPTWGTLTITTSEHYRFPDDVWLVKARLRRDVGVTRPDSMVVSTGYGT